MHIEVKYHFGSARMHQNNNVIIIGLVYKINETFSLPRFHGQIYITMHYYKLFMQPLTLPTPTPPPMHVIWEQYNN